ncbi:MAG: DUF1836 domain-containing protein [Lachnospiraceae bacterium]|nr:DUF1836 domain-containing protein [Lachnospiraceae bacterium]
MSIDTTKIIHSVMDNLQLINAQDIPAIDLYMDQVTTFMEKHLNSSKRYETDKVLTKTMINNYAKNKLLPPPEKKKYSKEHVLMLVFIYYFKNIMSINDIKTLLTPISDKYFNKENGLTLEDIYTEVCGLEQREIEKLGDELKGILETSKTTFTDAPKRDQEFLQLFSLICTLSYDVYVKKQMIEGLIDAISGETGRSDKNK